MVVVKIHEGRFKAHQYYLHHWLKTNLDALKKNMKKDFDAFLICVGDERMGKSTLAAQIAKYMDPSYNLDRCCFTAEQFLQAVSKSKKYQAVVFDEAYGYLSSRGALSKFNRTLIKVMTEMGSRNLFVLIVLPNFFELDKYPAIHRSTGLLRVYKRGKFSLYDKVRKKKLYLTGKKFYTYKGSVPNFNGDFTKYFPLDQEAYEKKKLESVMPIKDAMENMTPTKVEQIKAQRDKLVIKLSEDERYTRAELGEILGIKANSWGRLYSKIKKERFPPKKDKIGS